MQQYIVKPNDTLFLIAKEFDVPLAQLIEANPQIADPNMIQVGQTIIIPDIPPVPEQAVTIVANALSVIEDVIMTDWDSAMRRTEEIRADLDALIPIMEDAQVPRNVINGLNAAVGALEQNIRQRRTFSAISMANRITQLMADALDFFDVIVPTDLMRLAFFARQIIVNVEQNDWPEAFQNYRRALTVWERVGPELQDVYASDVTAFEQVLDRINEVIDRRDYGAAINNANRMLELLNVLASDFEQLYT